MPGSGTEAGGSDPVTARGCPSGCQVEAESAESLDGVTKGAPDPWKDIHSHCRHQLFVGSDTVRQRSRETGQCITFYTLEFRTL